MRSKVKGIALLVVLLAVMLVFFSAQSLAEEILVPVSDFRFAPGIAGLDSLTHGSPEEPALVGQGPVDFKLNVPVRGEYVFYLKYAAGGKRPLDLFVNRKLALEEIATGTTPSFEPGDAHWFKQGNLKLSAGEHLFTLDTNGASNGALPHLRAVRLELVPAHPEGHTVAEADYFEAPPPRGEDLWPMRGSLHQDYNLTRMGPEVSLRADCQGVPVYGFGYTYIYGLCQDFEPSSPLQANNTSPVRKIIPKKSWEIGSNMIGATPPRMPRTARTDFQPLLEIHLIDGDP